MHDLKNFSKSAWNLIIYDNKTIIFQSKARGLKPLIIFIKKFNRKFNYLLVFDKIVGRAAALLLVYIKTSQVYTPIISKNGALVLKKYKISFEAEKRVKYIMGKASKAMCQWEILAKNQTPKKFWQLVKNR